MDDANRESLGMNASQFGNTERYLIWKGGIFDNYIYSPSYDKEGRTLIFFTDFHMGAKEFHAGEHQLSAVVKLADARPTDEEISQAFINSLSQKICLCVYLDEKDYIDCMKTLPRQFFTEGNCEEIIENVGKEFLNSDKSLIQRSDEACCDLMEYAHSVDRNIDNGTGREYIGK